VEMAGMGYSWCLSSNWRTSSGTPNHSGTDLASAKTPTWIWEPSIRFA
jgi:hypothetical protein